MTNEWNWAVPTPLPRRRYEGAVTPAEALRQDRVKALTKADRENPESGYRLLADEAREFGFPMAERTAWRLCSDAGILSAVQRRRRRKGTKPGPQVHDDHVERVFAADAANRLCDVAGSIVHSDRGSQFRSGKC